MVKVSDSVDEDTIDMAARIHDATTGGILWRKGQENMDEAKTQDAESAARPEATEPQKRRRYHNPSFDAEFDEFDDFPGTIMEMDEVETEIVERKLKGKNLDEPLPKTDAVVDDQQDSTPKKSRRIFVWRDQPHYYYEIGLLVYISVWIWVYVLGKRRNEAIGKAFSDRYSPRFVKQFHTTKERRHMVFFRESTSDYSYYASGREHCHGMSLDLTLSHRQDLLYSLYGLLFSDRPDRIVISTALTHMDPFVFAIVRRSEAKYYIEDHNDLSNLTAQSIPGLDSNFVYITDTPQIALELLKGGLLDALKKRGQFVDCIHFSDLSHTLYPDVQKRGVLRFEFRVPVHEEDWKHLDALMELPFTYIDKIAQMNLDEQVKESTLGWRTNRDAEALKGNVLKKKYKAAKKQKTHGIRQPKKVR